MLSEKAKRYQSILVQSVDQRICIDRHGCRVEHYLIDLGQLLQEECNARANQDIDRNGSTFDHNPHMKVIFATRATCLHMLQRELAMNESFIQVENQGLAASVLRHLTVNDCVLGGDWGLAEATCL